MEVIHEERKVVVYNSMKFEIAQLNFGINRRWNLENIT
jgi:hypothetical protein